MIRCRGLRAGYGKHTVLDGIDLDVAPGEMVALLGPNGAGKTTLLLTLTGALAPNGGSVLLSGHDVTTLQAKIRAQRVAAVPQRAERTNAITVRALTLMGRYPYLSWLGGYAGSDEAAATAALEAVDMLPLADRHLEELSGGEFQRALVARALAQCCDVLVLDEASANLDIARKMELHSLLAARNDAGTTVVAALHDINLAALFCRRLVFIKNGRIAADGPVADVFTQQTLSRIYETDIVVLPHPTTGVPQALAVPCHTAPLDDAACRRDDDHR